MVSFPQISPPKPCINLSSYPHRRAVHLTTQLRTQNVLRSTRVGTKRLFAHRMAEFMRSVRFLEQTMIIHLNTMNQSVFVMETQHVFREVGDKMLYIISLNSGLQKVMCQSTFDKGNDGLKQLWPLPSMSWSSMP